MSVTCTLCYSLNELSASQIFGYFEIISRPSKEFLKDYLLTDEEESHADNPPLRDFDLPSVCLPYQRNSYLINFNGIRSYLCPPAVL